MQSMWKIFHFEMQYMQYCSVLVIVRCKNCDVAVAAAVVQAPILGWIGPSAEGQVCNNCDGGAAGAGAGV